MGKRKRRKKEKKISLILSSEEDAISYARVSSRMQEDNYSSSAQHRGNREFAKRKGWRIVREYTDVGSGTNTERSAFQEMLEDAKAGKFQHIICHKLDRFSRSVIDTLDMLQELEEYGISFSSSTEQFDFATPIGKVLLTLLAAFAELYVDNLRQETIKGQTERAAQGLWGSRLSFGYSPKYKILADAETSKRDEVALVNLFQVEKEAQAKNTFVPDATAIQDRNAEGVRLMFELASSGYASLQDIANALAENDYVPTGRGGGASLDRWTRDSVAYALKNLFYAGYVLYRGKYYEGSHKAIVTREEFDFAQKTMSSRAIKRGSSKVHRFYLLSQLMICAKCGGRIRATYRPYTTKDGQRMEYLYYRCSTPLKSGKCTLKNVGCFEIETLVSDFFMKIEIPENWQDEILRRLQSYINNDQDRETRNQLETRLKNIGILFEFDELTPEEYQARRVEIRQKLNKISPPSINPQLDKIIVILNDFKLFWKEATPEERQQLMQILIDHIVLDQDDEKIYAQVHIKPSAKILFDIVTGEEKAIQLVKKREKKERKRGKKK